MKKKKKRKGILYECFILNYQHVAGIDGNIKLLGANLKISNVLFSFLMSAMLVEISM